MTDTPTQLDPKVLERLAKLLALAADGGATEAEAQAAADKAAALMRQHNLTAATLEQAGAAAEGRVRQRTTGRAMYEWQRQLMRVCAQVNFVLALRITPIKGVDKGGYRLIGRESNVIACTGLFDYLCDAIARLASDAVSGDRTKIMSRYAVSFREGCASRLRQRLEQRHDQWMQEQEREAREARAARGHPSAATGNALVVVMRDWAQEEADLNADLRWGREPGTTAAERARGAAQWEADREARELRWAADAASEEARRAGLTEAQRRAEDEKNAREQARYEERRQRESDRYWARRSLAGHVAGMKAGENVGLDEQVGQSKAPDQIT